MTLPAWIGLGSNLGDRAATLRAAVAALAEGPGVVVEAVSSFHETRPVGGPGGQGAFLNAAARLRTTLGPRDLLARLQEIEDRLGRVRTVRWGERTVDLDLLLFGDLTLETPDLTLPHPRMGFRRFVLAPLAEIDPDLVDPATGGTIAGLLANLDRTPRVVAVAGPAGPRKDEVVRRLVEALGADRGAGGSAEPSWRVVGGETPEATLAVELPGLLPVGRPDPAFRAVPRLRPESDQPEPIVAEVVATCRAIGG